MNYFSRRMLILATTVLSFIGAAAWFYFLPYIAAKNLQDAAKKRDALQLSVYVDFSSVKESLKASFSAAIMSQVARENDANTFSLFGAALATTLINPIIDALVTPANLAMMMRGDKPSLDKLDVSSVQPAEYKLDTDVEMGYLGFDQFAISLDKKANNTPPVIFILARSGLFTWKLVSIQFPFEQIVNKAKPYSEVSTTFVSPKLIRQNLSSLAGKFPYELVPSGKFQNAFQQLLGESYNQFIRQIGVAGPIEIKRGFIFGEGCAPHFCGSDESAFAINIKTGEMFAAIFEDRKLIKLFGIHDKRNLPAPLLTWVSNNEKLISLFHESAK